MQVGCTVVVLWELYILPHKLPYNIKPSVINIIYIYILFSLATHFFFNFILFNLIKLQIEFQNQITNRISGRELTYSVSSIFLQRMNCTWMQFSYISISLPVNVLYSCGSESLIVWFFCRRKGVMSKPSARDRYKLRLQYSWSFWNGGEPLW